MTENISADDKESLKELIYQIIKRRVSCDVWDVEDEIGIGFEKLLHIMNELVFPDKRVIYANRRVGRYWVPRECDDDKYDYMFGKPNHWYWDKCKNESEQ